MSAAYTLITQAHTCFPHPSRLPRLLSVDRACTPLDKYQAIAALREINEGTCFALIRQASDVVLCCACLSEQMIVLTHLTTNKGSWCMTDIVIHTYAPFP